MNKINVEELRKFKSDSHGIGIASKITEAELELIRLLEKLKKRCPNERNTRVSLESKQSYTGVLKECLQECEGI